MRDLLHEVPSDADAETLARLFHALAHPTRLQIIALIARYGGMRAMELSTELGRDPQSLSFHLRKLENARLIARTSRTAPFCLTPGALERAAGALGVFR